MQHKEVRSKTSWFEIMIMCPSWATYLSTGYCFSELVHLYYKNPTKRIGLVKRGLAFNPWI
jgi:hypothetical protein